MKTSSGIMNTSESRIVKRTSMLKMALARSPSPSPIVLDTRADPPVPTIMPSAPTSITAGQMMFNAAKAEVPT